jgi:hypothetical protein
MKTFTELWPVFSFVGNLIIGLVCWLATRWLANTIKVAILELKEELRDTYATREQVVKVEADLRREIGLAEKMDEGFSALARLYIKHNPKRGNGDDAQVVR